MGEKIIGLLLVLVTSFFPCEARPDLNTSGNVDFYREGQNITAKWKTLDKDYVKIQVKYCDVTNKSPCLIHDVRDVKATEVTFRVLQFSKYECSLLVHDVGPVVYTSPRMPAEFRPDFSNITFIQKDEFITGTWQPFGSSYTTLKIRWCDTKSDAQDSSCDLYTVGNVSATTATVKVNKDKKYVCSVVVIDVTGESHSSEPILAEVKDTSNTNIIIIIVVVVIVIALIVVAVVLYLVLKRYCQAKDAYVVMPETEREAKQSMKRIRKQSMEHAIAGDEEKAAKYHAKDAHGKDNQAFIDNEKDKKNGLVKGSKVKKGKTTYEEPKIGYSRNDAVVEIVLKQPDTISLSSKSSQGDEPNYSGGRLEMEVEASMPDVVAIPDFKRKMSTDLDADSDIIDDVDVSLEVKAEAPVDVTPLESEGGPSVNIGHGDCLSGDGILNNVEIEISAPPEDSEGSLSSTCHSDAGVEVDVELSSRGSIDMADTRFHDPRYDGSFDLRFAGVAKRDSADSDDLDLDSKPDYERLESGDDSTAMEGGWPKGLKAQNSLESVEELNLDLAYGDDIKAEEPAVDIASPPIGVEGELDISSPGGELETTGTINVDPFDLAAGSDDISDVIPEHVGAVIDADRDGGLIHVQEGNLNADVDIPGGEVSLGTPEEKIGSDSSTHNTATEKGDSPKRNEPLKRISRKCSKLEKADHVCSHVLKERTHSRSESTSSLCSTCTTRSIESSSPTFSRSYSNSGSDTEKDVKDIEDEDDDVLVIGGGQMKGSVGSSGDVDVGLDLDGGTSNDFKMGIGAEIDVDAGLGVNADNEGIGGDAQLGISTEGDAALSAPAGFADEINIGAEDSDSEIDLYNGRPESTGLNLKVDLGLGGSLI